MQHYIIITVLMFKTLGTHGASWAHMVPHGAIWYHIGKYGSMCAHMGPRGAIWYHMGPSATMCHHVGPTGPIWTIWPALPHMVHTEPYGAMFSCYAI